MKTDMPCSSRNLSTLTSFRFLVFLVWISPGKCQGLLVLEDNPASDACRVMQFTNPIGNHSLVGHVITSARVESEIGCEARCFADDYCMSVNLGPLEGSKYLCELSSSDHNLHPEDLKYKKGFVYKPAWNYCSSSPCPQRHKCQTGFTGKGYRCIDFSETEENWKKINTDPVCFGAKDDSYGAFHIIESGLIYTFKLVHQSGSLSCTPKVPASYWGCLHSSYGDTNLVTVITLKNRTALSLAEYARKTKGCGYYSYKIEGVGVNSTELVFNNLPSPMSVFLGQEFQIWLGGDLVDCGERSNSGKTCVHVYAWYA